LGAGRRDNRASRSDHDPQLLCHRLIDNDLFYPFFSKFLRTGGIPRTTPLTDRIARLRGPIKLGASFDEFDGDLLVSYPSAELEFLDQPPSSQDLMASEDSH
jgi:hypothetical protein